MQKIITATDKEFAVDWCGPSTIDFALRFAVCDSTMQEVIGTFTNPEETVTLTHIFDNHETVFRGYTQFKGVDLKPNGSIVVALIKE